jgi:protein-S-isoprenylcysteine O-methyltransferase Ste14
MAEDDAAKVRFFPPGIPLLAILLGSIIEGLFPMDIGYVFPTPERYYVGGTLAIGAILIFGLWSVILFRKGGQSENPWKPTPSIEIRGPYKFTRNPMYLQMVLVCIGAAIAFANYWILLLTPVVAWALYICAIRPEEAYLETKFGETYLSYKARVRRWL